MNALTLPLPTRNKLNEIFENIRVTNSSCENEFSLLFEKQLSHNEEAYWCAICEGTCQGTCEGGCEGTCGGCGGCGGCTGGITMDFG